MALKAKYDLVVIGSGPGGQRAAVQAAKLHKSVLVIERDLVGGACLHTGTIPSKALRESTLTNKANPEIGRVMSQTHKVIDEEAIIIAKQLSRNSVDYVSGTASFISNQKVMIQGKDKAETQVQADYFVIATGTSPRRPSEVPFDDDVVMDSDSILRLQRMPKSLLVIGAGVIGCEYASIFSKMGIKVTLNDRRNELLRSIDPEIVEMLCKHFASTGLELSLGVDLKFGKRNQNSIDIEFVSAGASVPRNFEAVLYCMGRTGNAKDLNLDAIGLSLDKRGLLTVNANYQTSVENIYAVGDIIGHPALAASSGEQGRQASLHAFTKKPAQFPQTFPYGIYTIPEISAVGFSEAELKAQNIEFVAGRAHYRELARGKLMGDEEGMLKILVDKKTAKIMGIHAYGSGATEIIHIGQVAMAFQASIHFFVENVFNYPTLAEAYKVAAYNAFNQL